MNLFFTEARKHFFRPLTRTQRELIAACLRLFYDELYAPSGNDPQPMTRERVRDIFVTVLRRQNWAVLIRSDEAEMDEEVLDLADERSVANAILRQLEAFGWVESESDRISLHRVFRLSRAGKTIAGALAALDRPRAKTRQRNMRSAKSHLAAYLQGGDPDDLLDAHDYASRVTLDLQEDIEHFADLLRALARDAMENRLSWDDFADVLDNRVAAEYAARLVADSAERHRDDIVAQLTTIRAMDAERWRATEDALVTRAPWLALENTYGRPLSWLLRQTEEAVESACRTKMPELKASLQAYVSRFTSLLRQVMAMETSFGSSLFGTFCAEVKGAPPQRQAALLDALAQALGHAHVRLLEPSTLKTGSVAGRRKASVITYAPTMTPQARLDAAERAAVAAMFDFTQDEVLDALTAELTRRPTGVRLSDLPQDSARRTLYALAAVGAAQSQRQRFQVRKLDRTADTPTFVSRDYLFAPND